MWKDIQVTLTEGHKARYVQHVVRSEVVKLDAIESEELSQKRVDGGKAASPDECQIERIPPPGEGELPRYPGPTTGSRHMAG